MAGFEIGNVRNLTLVGHGGSGKTTLAEALLFKAGVTKRLGSVPDGTSILDYSEESRDKKSSLDSALCHFSYDDLHINLIDTPGVASFCGPAIASLAASEIAVIVVSAASGIQVNTRRMFKRARDFGLGVWIVVNHIDAPNVDLPGLLGQIQETFGSECVPINLPCDGGKGVIDCFANETGSSDFSDVGEVHTALLEALVGADDELMEKYLSGELSKEEAEAAGANAVVQGACLPVFFTESVGGIGIAEFLGALKSFCPSPVNGMQRVLVDGENKTELAPNEDGPFVGQVFKITTDPKSHIKYLAIRVLSGHLTSDMTVKSVRDPKGTRPGHILKLHGAEHSELKSGVAGDIIALAKIDFHIGETLYDTDPGVVDMPVFPKPMFALAIESKAHGDEDKISAALRRFQDEDICFVSERGTGGELVIRGMGDLQLRTCLTRMSHHHKLEVETRPPRIPYRETITGSATNIEYTHKKQSGGSGQFGRVIINVLPSQRGDGYEFVDKIFGGAIDQAFRPSVDKGVRLQMAEGVMAGYPVVDVKVELIDGKVHPVDSKDIAFQIAGRGAFREGFMKAKPTLLEPIVEMEVTVPSDHVGDIQGDLASRRGRPVGQEVVPGGMTVIKATVPLGEVADYASRLSSMTGGQGSYTMDLSHYDPVPNNVQQQIIDQHKKELEEQAAHAHH